MTNDEADKAEPHYKDHRKRLRQRFLAGGADALPDYELLELLLQHPHAVSSIARYAGYARDARLQALSLRVLYRLAMCERCLSYPQQLYSQLQVTRCVGVPGGGVAGFGNSL